jgi:5-hydroxyisourate hydrolase-like protein (transthyretin family)
MKSPLAWFVEKRVAVTLVFLILLVGAMLGAMYYVANIARFMLDQQQTLVYSPARFSPENSGALRVVVRDQTTNAPVANANVSVLLAPKAGGATQTLYTGKTDARGTAPVAFTVPANAARESNLIIETSSSVGRDRIEKSIIVQRNYKILVTTDKPLYQPGQLIHLRALALSALDRAPAKEQDLEFLIEDPKGNKIYRKTIKTSAWGIAALDFQLAETLNAGAYKITASIADVKSEKTVTVKPYVLPKFKVAVETEKSFYLPGERVSGRIRADYFFGKPVSKSDVTIKGIVYDIARAETINLTGKTDADGVYSFAFNLPNYFASTGLTKDRADFGLEISVTDQANHTEQTSLSLPIARDPIIVEAVAESGRLVAGVENIVYILTSLPDGSPLEAQVTIANLGVNVNTGKYGLAEVKVTPQRGNTNLSITARDAKGRYTARTITLASETTNTQILLRPDRATYRVGETMKLDVLSSGGVGTVYLDIVKEGQTISTRAEDAVSGRATINVDVSAELIGAIQLHAYHVERDGTITRDTRVVVIEAPTDLKIAIKPDREVYRPGDSSKINFSVTDASGKGVQSALGVSGVDEAVFALAEQDPGFAKLYFLLQKDLLEPRYQVKGFSLPEVVVPDAPKDQLVRAAQDQSARAAWSGAPASTLGLQVNSKPEKEQAAKKAQDDGENNLTNVIAIVLSAIPIAFAIAIFRHLHAQNILGKAMAWWMAGLMIYCVTSPMFIGALVVGGALLVQAKLGVVVTAALAIAWIIAFGVVLGYALIKREPRLQIALALLLVYFAFVAMLWFVSRQANAVNEWFALAAIFAYLAMLGLMVLFGIGLLAQKQVTPGIAAILLALLFIPLTILFAILPQAGPMLRVMGHPGLYIPPGYLMGCAAPAPGQGGNLFRDLSSGAALEQRGNTFSGVAPVMAPAPTAAPAAPGTGATQTDAPRLRQYFPETLYFNPQVITDERGNASLDIALADSITTWRLAVTASSQRGELGAGQTGIRVFQDFFVDLDLPIALTQNDEISIPVAIYNYLPQAQKVRLQIEKQSWFALQDPEEKTITIASNDIDVVYFRIKAINFGPQKLKVTALGEKMSDAIQRELRVYPDGKQIEVTKSNWLKGDTEHSVEIPAPAIPGASRIEVKIYPGIVAQAVNGLDSLLKVPYG